ncbi:CbtA family protein [Saccharopolyspora tripterygii]
MSSPFATFLRRGLLAGLLAGLTAALFSLLLVETPLRAALEVEEARSHAAGEHAHEELFSRPTQVVGGMVAALVVGLAIGTIFAVVFAHNRHRLPARTDFGRSLQLAASGFLAVSLLPALKYPANPPGVGDGETVTFRTVAYFSLIVAGIAILHAVGYLHRYLAVHGWSPARRSTAAAAGGIVLTGLVLWAWPSNPDPVPPDVPAALLWRFRLSSLAELAGMWTVLGFAFGLLNEPRKQRPTTTASPATAP